MSELLSENRDFLNLILDTESSQKRSLTQSITKKQVDAISEIFFNLNSISFTGNDAKFLNKKKRNFMKKIGNKKLSFGFRRRKLNKEFLLMVKILSYFKPELKKLIN